MSTRVRKTLALLSAFSMLVAQAVPAFAVCVCDVPRGETCCDSPPVPVVEEEHGCCSQRPAEPADQCAVSVAGGEQPVSISAHSCAKAVVSIDLSSITVPERADTTPPQFVTSVAILPALSVEIPAERRAALGFLRGPPATSSPPIFLLNASFLL